MKKRLIIAAMLLMAFGTMKAQDTLTSAPRKSDTIIFVMPDMSQLREYMRELGVNLQRLTDSVDWKTFEQDMEQWGEEMEEWGRKMEKWGEQFEKKYDKPNNYRPEKKDNSHARVIRVLGSGDVVISQTPGHFSLKKEGKIVSDYNAQSELLLLSGSGDYEVEISQLENVQLLSSADVISNSTIKGGYINIYNSGSGDIVMKVDYDTVHVVLNGSGDIILQGRCNVLQATLLGSGDLNVDGLNVVESNVEGTSSSKGNKTKGSRPVKKNLLLNPRWGGFEAGLNMLLNPMITNVYPNSTIDLTIRPLNSWYFGFNIADVGVAFNKRHTVGLFTGIGIGWNNFSWKNPVMTAQDPETGIISNVPLSTDAQFKRSKLGLLYLQVPLMFEIRPTRQMYIDLGVTSGLRFAAWSKVKFMDGSSYTDNLDRSGNFLNRFKLDASLRVGSRYLGFFMNYALIPVFRYDVIENTHPLSFGFSINL